MTDHIPDAGKKVLTPGEVAEIEQIWVGRTIYEGSEGQKTLALCASHEALRRELREITLRNESLEVSIIKIKENWKRDKDEAHYQIAARDQEIEKLQRDLAEKEKRIEFLQMQVDGLEHNLKEEYSADFEKLHEFVQANPHPDVLGGEKIVDCALLIANQWKRDLDAARGVVKCFMDKMSRFGGWDDGCFYYNGKDASELKEPIRKAAALIGGEHR